jgi:RNA polymerase sigma-70 factor (ECF subfamily)
VEEIGFEPWYVREHPRLVSALTVTAGDPVLAADAADEACTRAFERWNRVSAMESPGGWTYRTALNVLRRRGRRASVEARLLRRSPGRLAAPADWSTEVWDALQRLPRRERTAIALRYVADLTTDEIAAAMGVAPGTVGSTLNAARRNLARALGDDEAPARERVPEVTLMTDEEAADASP